jgi:DNA-binding FadR family transcriptional regulator
MEQLPPLPRLPKDANANGSSPAKTASLVARLLASYIVRHHLPEATRLPTETEMKTAFGVGRTTLREALRLLETQGLIAVKAGRGGGPLVRRPRAEDLGEAMSLLLQFENTPLAELLQARYTIEPTVVSLAVPRMSEDDLVMLHGNVQLSRRLTADEDHAEFVRYCRQFHTTLAEASGNTVLRVLTETLHNITDGAVASLDYTVARRKQIVQQHDRIARAVSERDAAAAAMAMQHHLDRSGHFWRTHHAAAFAAPLKRSLAAAPGSDPQ